MTNRPTILVITALYWLLHILRLYILVLECTWNRLGFLYLAKLRFGSVGSAQFVGDF